MNCSKYKLCAFYVIFESFKNKTTEFLNRDQSFKYNIIVNKGEIKSILIIFVDNFENNQMKIAFFFYKTGITAKLLTPSIVFLKERIQPLIYINTLC